MVKIISIIVFVTFFSLLSLNGSEKDTFVKNTISKPFIKHFNQNELVSSNLLKKLSEKSEDKKVSRNDIYLNLYKSMLTIGIVGVVGSGVSLLMVIMGSVFCGIGFNLVFSNAMSLGVAGACLIGVFASLLFLLFIPAAIIGFTLWYIFGTKAGMIVSSVSPKKVTTMDNIDKTIPSIAIQYTF